MWSCFPAQRVFFGRSESENIGNNGIMSNSRSAEKVNGFQSNSMKGNGAKETLKSSLDLNAEYADGELFKRKNSKVPFDGSEKEGKPREVWKSGELNLSKSTKDPECFNGVLILWDFGLETLDNRYESFGGQPTMTPEKSKSQNRSSKFRNPSKIERS